MLPLGLRQGEALELQWSRIDLKAGTLWGPQSPPAPNLAARLQRPLPMRRALPQDRGVQEGMPKAQADLPTAMLSRLHQPWPLVPTPVAARRASRSMTSSPPLARHTIRFVFASETGRPLDPRADNREWAALLKRGPRPRSSDP